LFEKRKRKPSASELKPRKWTKQFFISPDPTIPPRIVELGDCIEEMYEDNLYLLSIETFDSLLFVNRIGRFFRFVKDYSYLSDSGTEFFLNFKPPEGIVYAEHYWDYIETLFDEAYFQMLKDLGLHTITKELNELR
jgi:hypothetical protein